MAFPPPTSTLTFVRVFTDRGKRTPQILCARVKPFVDHDGCHVWRFDGPLPPTSWVAFPPKHRSCATCKILSSPHIVVRLALLYSHEWIVSYWHIAGANSSHQVDVICEPRRRTPYTLMSEAHFSGGPGRRSGPLRSLAKMRSKFGKPQDLSCHV